LKFNRTALSIYLPLRIQVLTQTEETAMAFTQEDANTKAEDIFTPEFWHTRSHSAPLGYRARVENLGTMIGAANLIATAVFKPQKDPGKEKSKLNIEEGYQKVANEAQSIQHKMLTDKIFKKMYLGPNRKHQYFFECLDKVAIYAMTRKANGIELLRTHQAIKDGNYHAAGNTQEQGDNYGNWNV
jgi:hypothetical protein